MSVGCSRIVSVCYITCSTTITVSLLNVNRCESLNEKGCFRSSSAIFRHFLVELTESTFLVRVKVSRVSRCSTGLRLTITVRTSQVLGDETGHFYRSFMQWPLLYMFVSGHMQSPAQILSPLVHVKL